MLRLKHLTGATSKKNVRLINPIRSHTGILPPQTLGCLYGPLVATDDSRKHYLVRENQNLLRSIQMANEYMGMLAQQRKMVVRELVEVCGGNSRAKREVAQLLGVTYAAVHHLLGGKTQKLDRERHGDTDTATLGTDD